MQAQAYHIGFTATGWSGNPWVSPMSVLRMRLGNGSGCLAGALHQRLHEYDLPEGLDAGAVGEVAMTVLKYYEGGVWKPLPMGGPSSVLIEDWKTVGSAGCNLHGNNWA